VLAIVLAAGRGKRLRPLTDARSKAMLPVAGQPMVGRVLTMLQREGCDRFIVVAHPEDHALREYVRRAPLGERCQVAFQVERKGMADALACAAPLILHSSADDFVLAACDNLYPEGHVSALITQHRAEHLDATLTLMHVQPEQVPTLAVVAFEGGRVTRIVEKPRLEDAPSDVGVPALYVIARHVLDLLPRVPISERGELEFPDVLRLLLEGGGRVGGRLVAERWTLTRWPDLLMLNRHFLRQEPSCVETHLPANTVVIPPVRIEGGVSVAGGCRIGPEVYLESGCRLGGGATIRRAVLLQGAVIEPGAVVEDAVLG
jgi:NDP-sugar pyrophosphorylase family protein